MANTSPDSLTPRAAPRVSEVEYWFWSKASIHELGAGGGIMVALLQFNRCPTI